MVNDIDLLAIEKDGSDGSAPTPPPHRRRKKRPLAKAVMYTLGIAAVIFFVFTSKILMSGDSSIKGTLSFIGQLTKLAQTSENMLKGEESDRVNVLLLGMGGEQHAGGYLTDTIMLASIQPSTGNIAMVSIPRDMVVPLEGHGWRKVNNVNAFAEAESPGSGGRAVSQALSKILDIPIDYYVRVDFVGFEQIIDDLGGVDVYVDNTLEDRRYPIRGREEAEDYDSRYEHLYIEEGQQHMDGSLALKYARSRHALGVEGSDFARSRRQQKVLQAVKEKLLSSNLILRPRTISNVLSTVSDHMATNIKIWEIVKLWDIVKESSKDQIVTEVLDDGPGGLLVAGRSEEGAYILQPRSGDFSEIQYLVQNVFSDAPPVEKSEVTKEYPKLEIQNGTWVNGLAQRTATDLEKYGFDVVDIANASRQDHAETIVYDLTYGEKMKTLETIKEQTGARVHYGLPDWLAAELAVRNAERTELVQPDFILILGQNADATQSGIENKEEE